jgi:hypothetical protein
MIESDEITQFAIYPSIGIARIGNSQEHFFGPEQPGTTRKGPYRDEAGRIKRQAARFRVYGLNNNKEVIKEITLRDAQIEWKVEVANKKAAWFVFDQALDLEKSLGSNAGPGIASRIRNLGVTDRASLAITPPPVTISRACANKNGSEVEYQFWGRFRGKKVYLGEVRTDECGRLVFLGGRGESGSIEGGALTNFANNDLWYDDVCDGPVDATVKYKGTQHNATGAWVIVGPPDYAPGVRGIITGYDLLFDVATQLPPPLQPLSKPLKPSFSEYIYPLLRRFTQHQWVNAGFARQFGFGTPIDFEDPAFVDRLRDPSAKAHMLRTSIFRWFRDHTSPYLEPTALPPYYGDGMTFDPRSTDPRRLLAILPTQYDLLKLWAADDFIDDYPSQPPRPWAELTPAEQVCGIDRAVLDEVLGGPFHPGAEFTWPMRLKILYSAPFRIRRRTKPEWLSGTQLVSSVAAGEGGPLDGSTPGDVTRWMAVPWQADTSSCLSGYMPYVDDYLPTFWPARAPNDVLSREQYGVLMNHGASPADKELAFDYRRRVKWLRGIAYPMTPDRGRPPPTSPSPEFVRDWWKVGIVEWKSGPGGSLPKEMWVEDRKIDDDLPEITPQLRHTGED